MLLHEQHVWARWVHGNPVDTMADLSLRVRDIVRPQTAVNGLPRLASVVRPEGTRGRDGDEDTLRVAWIQENRVQTEPASARLPAWTGAVPAQPSEFLPSPPAIGRAEQGGVLHASVNRVRIGQGGFEMPNTLELPRVGRTVIPLVRAGDAFVDKLVAHRLPCHPAIRGALDHLPKPAGGLRGVQSIQVSG
ncbi:MAG: hypothetical protein PVG14_15340 [Anaerolineales bacterium]